MPATAIPDTVEGFQEFMADATRVRASLDEGDFGDVVSSYVERVQAREGEQLSEQVMTEVQATLAQFMADNAVELNRKVNAAELVTGGQHSLRNRDRLYNPDAPGAALDAQLTDGVRGYLRDIWHGNQTADAAAFRQMIRNDYSSHDPSTGGFLIPETLRSELLRVSLETAVVRPRARVIPMESLRVPFPVLEYSSNSSSIYGGIVAYWTEESQAITESEATFRRVVLEAKKLAAYSEVPNELFQDSIISLESFLTTAYPEGISWFEDTAFISGTGAGEPKGFRNAASLVTVAAEAGQTADTIVWENIVKMYARMLPSSLSRAVWVVNQTTFPELATMALSVGTGGSAIWLNNGSEGPPMRILGRPVIVCEKVPELGTAGDINFVDFGYYLIGDRQAMTSDTSPHYKFPNDQTAFRVTERVDGRPWIQSAVTPANGDTLSPFVDLATRS